jgi:hypothetical protein
MFYICVAGIDGGGGVQVMWLPWMADWKGLQIEWQNEYVE